VSLGGLRTCEEALVLAAVSSLHGVDDQRAAFHLVVTASVVPARIAVRPRQSVLVVHHAAATARSLPIHLFIY